MQFSIATVSLGGSLSEKLAAIARAGFEGVEIFEADVLAHDGSPAEIGRMVRDAGLAIVAFQPFRDFEGMPEPQRTRGFERARRKFALMNELGASRILVCSNVSPLALGGIDRAADDLRELGGIAEGFGIDVGFEALAWGRHVWDYRDAWEIVRRADHPRVGLILDSWHLLARGLPTDPIRAIPADRMTFVQLADAPKMDMDLLQWSRHFRNFPGQGDMPVDAFMAAVLATGYDGWLSLEIFNDRFRMSLPRRIAEDGERSLIWLGDRARPGALPPRVKAEAVEWVEFAVSETDEVALSALFEALGFTLTGRHRSKQVDRWTPGRDQPGHQHRARGARAFASAGARPVSRRARSARRRRRGGAGAGRGAAHPGLPPAGRAGRTRHPGGARPRRLAHLLHRPPLRPLAGSGRSSSSRPAPRPATGLARIDHIAQSMTPEEMLSWRLYYLSLFAFETTPQVDVIDPAGIVESLALQDADRGVRICLNASASERTLGLALPRRSTSAPACSTSPSPPTTSSRSPPRCAWRGRSS